MCLDSVLLSGREVCEWRSKEASKAANPGGEPWVKEGEEAKRGVLLGIKARQTATLCEVYTLSPLSG